MLKKKKKEQHAIMLLLRLQEMFLLLFPEDIVLVSSTPSGLQNQINNLENASNSLGLTVNLDKTKVMTFRKGGHKIIGSGERLLLLLLLYGNEIEIVNN